MFNIKTMLDEEPAELTTRSYPSDHLPLVAEISLQQKKGLKKTPICLNLALL